ncbi:MAG TPA: HlyD family efflux transporter periplasmic adaptor subunit [Luteibaculaceae bacterium]|nr:HlyD family efflux transporter periplasmic adaptor subunit [Luteibaculaceae bacterium]
MLNLSPNRIDSRVDRSKYKSFHLVKEYHPERIFRRILWVLMGLMLLLMFMPWTQNIRTRGYLTALRPDQRPQTIHSIIAGRIEKWYVGEGDFVKRGDTILFISEIKDEYFDPKLLSRTEEQIKAKELSVNSYMEKVRALDTQIDALIQTRKLKLEQAQNYVQQAQLKIQSDSIDVQAAVTNFTIAQRQLERMEQLYKDGLKSLTDLEARRLKLQEALAKKISAENKLLSSRNELINAEVELGSLDGQYADKLAKAESDKYAALSSMYDAEAVVTKMQNQYSNYSVRTGYYVIRAPQDGFITKAIKTGIGETVKEGEELVSIMPSFYNLAVAMYIEPVDLPLVNKGQPIRFMFDGWPSVVFSGWPNLSYGTFGGRVVAIDNFISENGKYRILVSPDKRDVPWPKELRVGSGANGIALLKDVPIWYEIWRKLNGFPPDYYQYNAEEDAMLQKLNKLDKKSK